MVLKNLHRGAASVPAAHEEGRMAPYQAGGRLVERLTVVLKISLSIAASNSAGQIAK
jgi:hypothetical protein